MLSKVASVTNMPLCFIVILASTALYQTVDLSVKKHLARQISQAMSPDTIEYSYKDDDRPNQLPVRLRPAALTVEWLDDEVYGLYADDDWKSLFPFGQSGFVSLGPSRDLFAVGMYHQLHCLDVFRVAYAAAKAHALVFPGNGTGYDHHVGHCLSYMREMILCNADSTLIPTVPVESGEYAASSDGVTHRCRDWTQLRQWVENNMMETSTTAKGL